METHEHNPLREEIIAFLRKNSYCMRYELRDALQCGDFLLDKEIMAMREEGLLGSTLRNDFRIYYLGGAALEDAQEPAATAANPNGWLWLLAGLVAAGVVYWLLTKGG
jgi:hypothetical protein